MKWACHGCRGHLRGKSPRDAPDRPPLHGMVQCMPQYVWHSACHSMYGTVHAAVCMVQCTPQQYAWYSACHSMYSTVQPGTHRAAGQMPPPIPRYTCNAMVWILPCQRVHGVSDEYCAMAHQMTLHCTSITRYPRATRKRACGYLMVERLQAQRVRGLY